MRSVLVRSALFAILFAVVLGVGEMLTIDFYDTYKQPLDPQVFHALSPERQQQWLAENIVRHRGAEYVRLALSDSWLLKGHAVNFLIEFGIAWIVMGGVFAWRQRARKA
jgi:uncharacterized membrane protein YciS (DUF1049 family)